MKTPLLTLFFLLTITSSVRADKYSVNQVQTVDMQSIINRSKLGQNLLKKLKESASESERLITQKKAEVDAERKALESQASLLSESAFVKKQQELVEKNQLVKDLISKEQQRIEQMKTREMLVIVEKAQKAINDLSKERGYVLVVEKSSPTVIFSDKEMDITSEILAKIGG